MDFGIMFFSSTSAAVADDRYRLLIEACRRADAGGLRAAWVPERHFHRFGGLYPNPSVIAAALAMVTTAIEIRAGSLVSPLHDAIRIFEDWAVVDNLSRGRVAISFGSGWNRDDFVFYPDRFDNRQAVMYRQIEQVRALWRGERLRRGDGDDRRLELEVFPRPVQHELPVWVTSSGNPRTFEKAGEIGANLLTHLIGQSLEELAEKVQLYRQSRGRHGFDPAAGVVTLMLHTFLGDDLEAVRERVSEPFRRYLSSAISLERMAAMHGGVVSGGHRVAAHDIPRPVMEELLDLTFERYFSGGSLLGTADSCAPLVWNLIELGIDEVACLIDFLDDDEAVLASLARLIGFQARFSRERLAAAAAGSVGSFMEELEP